MEILLRREEMKISIRFFILLLLSIVVLSCTTVSQNPETQSTQTSLPTTETQQLFTQTPFIASTPKSKAFLPVQEGTPIPILQKEISIDSISQVVKLARWGNGFPRQATYSPNGKFIALGTSIGVRIYRSDTLELIRFIETPSDIGSVAISPDGIILAAGGRELLLIYKMNDGTLL